MSIKSFTGRVSWYRKKHGWMQLVRLSFEKVLRWINKKEIVYCLDLNRIEADSGVLRDGLSVECYHKAAEVTVADMEQLVKLKSKDILAAFLDSFFRRDASLWLIKENGRIAGLIWSKVGGLDGYYLGVPILPDDAIILAGETFPEFRGRSHFSVLIRAICERLKKAGVTRAYGGAHVGNVAAQRAHSKVWKKIGVVRHFGFAKWHVAIWDKDSLMMDYK